MLLIVAILCKYMSPSPLPLLSGDIVVWEKKNKIGTICNVNKETGDFDVIFEGCNKSIHINGDRIRRATKEDILQHSERIRNEDMLANFRRNKSTSGNFDNNLEERKEDYNDSNASDDDDSVAVNENDHHVNIRIDQNQTDTTLSTSTMSKTKTQNDKVQNRYENITSSPTTVNNMISESPADDDVSSTSMSTQIKAETNISSQHTMVLKRSSTQQSSGLMNPGVDDIVDNDTYGMDSLANKRKPPTRLLTQTRDHKTGGSIVVGSHSSGDKGIVPGDVGSSGGARRRSGEGGGASSRKNTAASITSVSRDQRVVVTRPKRPSSNGKGKGKGTSSRSSKRFVEPTEKKEGATQTPMGGSSSLKRMNSSDIGKGRKL